MYGSRCRTALRCPVSNVAHSELTKSSQNQQATRFSRAYGFQCPVKIWKERMRKCCRPLMLPHSQDEQPTRKTHRSSPRAGGSSRQRCTVRQRCRRPVAFKLVFLQNLAIISHERSQMRCSKGLEIQIAKSCMRILEAQSRVACCSSHEAAPSAIRMSVPPSGPLERGSPRMSP